MDNIQPGQTIGAYRIIHQIGQGGMATVYKAYHAAMDRYVALKVLPRQLAESQEFTGRFQQEARIIANLEHPHILPVHDYGETDGITYLVMRFMDAGTLKEKMQAGALPLNEVDRLFTQLADALDYAHTKGVIHRDLKPSNVLVDARGSVFLTDFGIAKLLESSSQFTGTGAMVGTPAYMSPEQAQGTKVDQRTDIYALGIILYEMVTGRVPFEAETPLAVILKHLNEPLPLPSAVKPDISPSIERILLKALAKNPEDRYATVGEFVTAWKSALSEVDTLRVAAPPVIISPTPGAQTVSAPAPVHAQTPTVTGPAPTGAAAKPAKRPRWMWLAGGAGGLCVVCLCALAVVWPRLGELAVRATQTAEAIRIAEVSATTATAAGADSTPGPGAGEPGWTQWVPANVVFGVTAVSDQVVTWGRGGISVWDRNTGELSQRLTTLDGLPESQVNAVLVDEEDDVLWAGTNYGLGRYHDGEWVIYDRADGLDSDTISALTWDSQNLIVGTLYSSEPGSGLMSFDGERWSRVPDFPSDQTDARPDLLSYDINELLFDDNNDVLWVATNNGLGRYDGQSWTSYFVEQGLPDNRTWALLLDDNGDLWVGTENGAARFNGDSFEVVERLEDQDRAIYGITMDGEGRYWFAGSHGLARFDPQNGDWELFSSDNANLPATAFLRATTDDDGNLYFGSYNGGLIRYDGEDFSAWTIAGLPQSGGFSRIVPDPDGTLLFVEEYGAVVDRYNPATGEWSPAAIPCDGCRPLLFDPDGNLWMFGYVGAWLARAEGGPPLQLTTDQGLPSDVVFVIAVDSGGSAWIGTDQGVAVFDGSSVVDVFTTESVGLPSNDVRALLKDSYGNMWVGTVNGLSRFTSDGQWEHFTENNPFVYSDVFISDLTDVNGVIWVATRYGGFYSYTNGEWRYWPSDSLTAIAAAPDGSLWFGTYNNNAFHFVPDTEESTAYTESDGLPNYNINDVYVEPGGAVWFATSNGIARFVP